MNQMNSASDRTGILSQLFDQFGLAWKLFLDGRVPALNKLLLPLLVLAYFIFPVDFLPDFIPGLGQLDDLAVVLVAIRLFVMLAPKDVVSQYRTPVTSDETPASAGWTQPPPEGNVVDATYRLKD